MTEQEIKKEVISQMFWEFMGIDYCMRKDLDDVCEDIYNKIFVPLLKKIRKQTAKEFAEILMSVLWEEEKDETIRIEDVHRVIRDVVRSKYCVEVE